MKDFPEKLDAVPYLPLEIWNRRWELDGIHVRCKACSAQQKSSNFGYPFMHRLHCSVCTSVSEYPLRELYQILKNQIDQGLA